MLPNPTCVKLYEPKDLAERMMLRRDCSKLSGWSQGRVFTREKGRWVVRVREDVGMKAKERKRGEEGERKGETD